MINKKLNTFITKKKWKFNLGGKSNELEVEINDFTGKIRFILNGEIHHNVSTSPFLSWQNISFKIENHKCNLIYTSGMPFSHKDEQECELIIDGYSIATGELYNFSKEKQKYLKRFYIKFIRVLLGVIAGSSLSGYFLANMNESWSKFFLRTIIFLIGFYIGIFGFDIITYVYKSIIIRKD